MGFIDGSVVTVALPAIQRNFAVTFGMLLWVVNGYMLVLASLVGSAVRPTYMHFIVGIVLVLAA